MREKWHQGEAQGHCKCRLNSANCKMGRKEEKLEELSRYRGEMQEQVARALSDRCCHMHSDGRRRHRDQEPDTRVSIARWAEAHVITVTMDMRQITIRAREQERRNPVT